MGCGAILCGRQLQDFQHPWPRPLTASSKAPLNIVKTGNIPQVFKVLSGVTSGSTTGIRQGDLPWTQLPPVQQNVGVPLSRCSNPGMVITKNSPSSILFRSYHSRFERH